MASQKKSTLLTYLAVLLIVLAGTALRVSYNANTFIVDPVRADAANYLKYAHNMLDYGIFSKDIKPPPVPDAFWAPGFPLYLSAVIKISQWLSLDTYNFILASQVLLGAGTIFLCYLVSAAFLSTYWALLPPLLVAGSPHLVATGSYVLTETLFGFLLLLSLYSLSRALASDRKLSWLLTGLSFAVCYLVNPIALLLPPLLATGLLLRERYQAVNTKRSRLVLCAALLIAPVIIASTAWTVRTVISVPPGQPTASGRLVTNLIIGIYPDYHQKWRDSILKPQQKIKVPGTDIDQSYGAFFSELGRQFTSDPIRTLRWYAIDKPILLWDWDIRTGWGDIYIYRIKYSLYQTSATAIASYAIMKSVHVWLLACAALGLGYLFFAHQGQAVLPTMIYLSALYISGVYVLSQSEPRYSIPLRPELYICATFFMWRSWEWIERKRRLSQMTADQPT